MAFRKSIPISLGCLQSLPPGPGFPQGGVLTNSKQKIII